MDNVKLLLDFISEYESVNRFSRNHLIRPENLVHHVGVVSIISAYLVNKMTEDFNDIHEGEILTAEDCCALMMRAVVHDMDEIVTGDVVRPTKYANKDINKLLKQLESESIPKIIREFNLPRIWQRDWENAKADKAGIIIKVADGLAVVMTCYREIKLYSNNQFRKVAIEARDYLVRDIGKINQAYADLRRSPHTEYYNSKEFHQDSFFYEYLGDILIEAHDILAKLIGAKLFYDDEKDDE